jgi:hypothetical protein
LAKVCVLSEVSYSLIFHPPSPFYKKYSTKTQICVIITLLNSYHRINPIYFLFFSSCFSFYKKSFYFTIDKAIK